MSITLYEIFGDNFKFAYILLLLLGGMWVGHGVKTTSWSDM